MTGFLRRHVGTRRSLFLSGCLAVLGASMLLDSVGAARAESDQQELVDKATATIEAFLAHPDMTWLSEHMPTAKAVMIVPTLIKAGFILGGSGGNGVLLLRGEDGEWSYPSFAVMGSGSIGFQIGGSASEVVLLVQTDAGVDAMLSTEFKIGGDASAAAGPVGAGTKAATTDVLAFSRDKGLFAGLSVEGAVIKPKDEWNASYYGEAVSPTDILMEGAVSNAGADALRAALKGS